MIKRLLVIITIAIVATMLASCDATPDAYIEVAHSAPARGFWEDNTFVSPFFGLRFDVPEDWDVLNDEAIADMFVHADIEYAQIPQGGEVTVEFYEAVMELGIIDMSASGHASTRGITVRLGRLPDGDADMTALQFLENMVATMNPPATTEVIIHEETRRIGTQDWYYASFTYPFRHEMAYNLYFVNIDGMFVRSVIVSHFGSIGSIDDTIELFRPY